jgi:toxin CptA
MTSAPAIGFEYRPSRWLGRVLLVMAALALLALSLSNVPVIPKVALAVVLIAAVIRAWTRFARSSVIAAGWSHRGGWTLRMVDGEDQSASLRAFRVAGEHIVWLHLAAPGQRSVSLLLAPDNSDTDIRRRLRMRLALASKSERHAAGHSAG